MARLSINAMPCLRCGTCCSIFDVRVSLEEAHRIVDTIGISWDEWLNSYIDKRWPGTESFILRRINGSCIFLKATGEHRICSIHTFKPSLCIEWKEGTQRAECRQGLQKRWGITVENAAEIDGTSESIEKFRDFLKRLT